MLDTTEFNAVAKSELSLSLIKGRRVFATHVQLDEINKTHCERTRAELQAAFAAVAADSLPTESFVLDVRGWAVRNYRRRIVFSINDAYAP
jgi:hypothetical protein